MGIYKKFHDRLKYLAHRYGTHPVPDDAPLVAMIGSKSFPGSNAAKIYNKEKLAKNPNAIDTIYFGPFELRKTKEKLKNKPKNKN